MVVVPMQLGLTDPSWDLIDPTPDIHAMFENFNQIFFFAALDSVEVKWSNRMTSCAGVCSYEGNGGLCSVRLSAPLLKLRPRKDLVETLLHEMIHAYLFVTCSIRDRDGHGPEFKKHMNRINEVAGTKISIYHEFGAEVLSYKVHVWHCSGPCRFSHPFYGTVRRAKNRAPGPNDRWFSYHARRCNGFFTKELGGPPAIERKPPQNNGDIRKYMSTYKPISSEENNNSPKHSMILPFNGKGHRLGGGTCVTSDNSATVTRPSSTLTIPTVNGKGQKSRRSPVNSFNSATAPGSRGNSASPMRNGTGRKSRRPPVNSFNSATTPGSRANSASPTRNGTGQKSRRPPVNSVDSAIVASPQVNSASPTRNGTERKSRRTPGNSSNSSSITSPLPNYASPERTGTEQKSRRLPGNSSISPSVTSPPPNCASPTRNGTGWKLGGRIDNSDDSSDFSDSSAPFTSPSATSLTSPIFNGPWKQLGRTPIDSSNSALVSTSAIQTIPEFIGSGLNLGDRTIRRPLATITRPSETITRPSETITRPSETITRPLATITRPSVTATSMTAFEVYNANTRPPATITHPSAAVSSMTAAEAYNAYADSFTSTIPAPLNHCDGSSKPISVFKATSGTLDVSLFTAALNESFACPIYGQNYEKSLIRSVSDNGGKRLGYKYPEASHAMFNAIHGGDRYGRINGIGVDRVTDARFIPHKDLTVVPVSEDSAGPSELPFITLDESTTAVDWSAITDDGFIPFADAPAGTSSGYQGDHSAGSSQRMPARISSNSYSIPEQNAIATVECPICRQSVITTSINYHIDSNCTKGMSPEGSLHDKGIAYESGKHNKDAAEEYDDESAYERGEDGVYRKCDRDVYGIGRDLHRTGGTNDYVATNKRSMNGDDAIIKRSKYDFGITREATVKLFAIDRDGGTSSKACYICGKKFGNSEMLIEHEQTCVSSLFPNQVVETDMEMATVPDVDTGPQMTVCPNCGGSVPFATINAHLDYCLLF